MKKLCFYKVFFQKEKESLKDTKKIKERKNRDYKNAPQLKIYISEDKSRRKFKIQGFGLGEGKGGNKGRGDREKG